MLCLYNMSYAFPITSLEGLKADITALPELCLLGWIDNQITSQD